MRIVKSLGYQIIIFDEGELLLHRMTSTLEISLLSIPTRNLKSSSKARLQLETTHSTLVSIASPTLKREDSIDNQQSTRMKFKRPHLRVSDGDEKESSVWINEDIRPLPPSRRLWTKTTYISFWAINQVSLLSLQIALTPLLNRPLKNKTLPTLSKQIFC